MVRPPCRPLPPENSVPYRIDCFVVSPIARHGRLLSGRWPPAAAPRLPAGGVATAGGCCCLCCFDHSSNILRICFIWAGVNSASSAQTVACGIIMRTARAPAIKKKSPHRTTSFLLGTLTGPLVTKGALVALTSYILMYLPDSSALLINVLTLRLLRAWRQNDFAFLQTVVGNGDNPFAAFALDFEHIPAKFRDELTRIRILLRQA